MDLYGNRLPPPIPRSSHHELKRPDSVITTSSIVSSDTASQAGDSSTETSGPPSAYAISGLYGSHVQPGQFLKEKKIRCNLTNVFFLCEMATEKTFEFLLAI